MADIQTELTAQRAKLRRLAESIPAMQRADKSIGPIDVAEIMAGISSVYFAIEDIQEENK